MRSKRLIIYIGIIAIIGLLIYFPGRKHARSHINWITATDGHPMNCLNCHLYKTNNSFIKNLVNKDYYSPINLAVSNDGKTIYTVAQDANELIVINTENNQVKKHIKVGLNPHSVVLSSDNSTAYVSNQWADYISVIDLKNNIETDSLPTGNGPSGLVLSKDEKFLYVVNTFSSDLTVLNLELKQEVRRLPAGFNPTGIDISPGGEKIYVSSRRAHMVPYGDPLITDVVELNSNTQRVKQIHGIRDAYMMENITFTPSGDLALMSLIRPKNLVPTVQVERGWMMNHGFGIIEQGGKGRTVQLLLDEPNAYYSDPFDIVVSPDGKRAYVSSSGVRQISVIDLEAVRKLLAESTDKELAYYSNNLAVCSQYIIKRIPTGWCPKGLALSADGSRLYVAELLEDKIGVIDTKTFNPLESIHLSSNDKVTVSRKGRRLFTSAGGTFQNQYSCYTCHPDYHEDGLVYNMAGKDMGRNVTNTQSLREIGETAPFKWNAKNQTVYKQDGMRFSTILTRTEAYSFSDLDALTSFIMTGIKNPPNLMYNPHGELTAAQKRGKEIFERKVDNFGKPIQDEGRCIFCHPAPYYSNFQPFDVGTLAETDDSILFDTPHLNNIFASPPYLHDGRANTLEEIWTVHAENDEHGVVNDMTKMQLNDLIAYLNSLRSSGYESTKAEKPEQILEASIEN